MPSPGFTKSIPSPYSPLVVGDSLEGSVALDDVLGDLVWLVGFVDI